MPRHSPRKKPISPEAVESDNNGFVAVASDDQYVAYVFHLLYGPLCAFSFRKNCLPSLAVESEEDDDM